MNTGATSIPLRIDIVSDVVCPWCIIRVDDMRMVNTFRAHQLLHWAAAQGRQTELKLELFEAFFTRGEDVNDAEVLLASSETA